MSRILIRHTGRGFNEHVRAQRLMLAQRQLASTLRSIKEVADIAGYKRSSDFCRQFRTAFGMTPMQYRSTLREPIESLNRSQVDRYPVLRAGSLRTPR